MPVPFCKRIRRAVRSVLIRGLVSLLGWLPLGLALGLGEWVGRFAWLFLRRERRRMLGHLAVAFPEKGVPERCAIGRACLIHLGQSAMEVLVLRRGAFRIEDYVSIAPGGEELLRDALARGKGVIFAAGHLGNWELLARRLAVIARPSAVVARRNGTSWLNGALEALRLAGGLETIWRDEPSSGRRILQVLRHGGGLGLLIDQDTKVQGVFVPFFGRLAFTPRAVADLALRFGATVLVVVSHRRAAGGHEVEIAELGYDIAPSDAEREVERLTAAVVAAQERAIRLHPAEWVWMHRRWKTRPAYDGAQAKLMPKTRELSRI